MLSRRMSRFLVLVGGLILTTKAAPVFADGDDDDDVSASAARLRKEFQDAERAVRAGKYDRAIKLLEGVIRAQWRNASAHNLMGYSYRKKGALGRAANSYQLALQFDPEHKGALEYQGEMFLKMGDLAAAERNLAALQALCPSGCRQLAELQRAIADFHAAKGRTGAS